MGWEDAPITTPASELNPEANPAPQPAKEAWENAPIIFENPDKGPRTVDGIGDAIVAGAQSSVFGLAGRGRLPDVQLSDEESKWYERAAAGITQIGADLPFMIMGGVAGTAAGGSAGSAIPVVGTAGGALAGGGFGAFALPAALRESYVQSYLKGEVTGVGDFLSRTAIVTKSMLKEGAIGAAAAITGGAAGVAAKTAGAGAIGTAAARLGAEEVAFTVLPPAFEGRLPEPRDALDAAILLVGMHGANMGARRLMQVYAKTGKTPAEVLADAQRDPTIAEDLARPATKAEEATVKAETMADATAKADVKLEDIISDTEVPRAYREQAKQEMLNNVLGADRAMKIDAVIANPTGEISTFKEPNHINYRYLDSPQDVVDLHAALSTQFKAEIEAQRGTQTWEQTQQKALEVVSNREPGDVTGKDFTGIAAEAMAQEAMAQRAAYDAQKAAENILLKGDAATPADHAALSSAIETAALLKAVDQKNGAEIARALNARKASKQSVAMSDAMTKLMADYGQDPQTLARMITELKTSDQIANFGKKMSKATTWEQIVEAWKAGLVSGPKTQIANILGNFTFMATRPLVDLVAAAVGRTPLGSSTISFAEPFARVVGNINGVLDGLKLAGTVLKTGAAGGSTEQFRKAIPGTAGEIIRAPFRMLSAADAFFRTTNERGEIYTRSTRQAVKEGYNPATREFRERVAELASNPTDAMQKEAATAAQRFTFNAPLGETGQQFQKFVRKSGSQWLFPFIQTPANVIKEMIRLTPAAPVIKEWRTAFAEGGAAKERAIAEMVAGTVLSTAVFAVAASGNISGQGDPDPGKRQAAIAAGWQPYSIKIGGEWYSYQRIPPVGTIIGMAADARDAWEHMTDDERDKVPKILAVAFANAITSQTFLQGVSNIINAITDPTRFAGRFFEGLAGSLVPAFVAQAAALTDPYQREVNGVIDAVQARIPGLRQYLEPKIDAYGQPVPEKKNIFGIVPIATSTESTDKVRTEVARLNIKVPSKPDYVKLPSGKDEKLGQIDLNPQQQRAFMEEAGKQAYDILDGLVNSPGWDETPDLIQSSVISQIFSKSRAIAKGGILTPEQLDVEMKRIDEEMAKKLAPK